MLLLSIAAALLAQTTPPPADTADAVFDSPATRELVERTIRESGQVPVGLRDFRADVRTGIYLSLAADSSPGGEFPLTADEFVGEVRWRRSGYLHQWVHGHRLRMLVPVPYTLGTMLERPWVIPHLYGPTISVLSLAPGGSVPRGGPSRAVHPLGEMGPRHYRYTAGDTVHIRVQGDSVTLVPIEVRPRVDEGEDGLGLVAGTFFLDTDRAAVARARFGFVGGGRGLRVGEMGTFLELENGLWEGQYWLPYRQRREVQVTSPLLGGAVAGRVVTLFTDYDLNTGWIPQVAGRLQLFRDAASGSDAFTDWDAAMGGGAAEWDITDFADLRRLAAESGRWEPGALRFTPHYERGDHLFRYNRVEGPYLGLGGRLAPSDPLQRRWDVYATAGWAFAEATPRGELVAHWHPAGAAPTAGGGWSVAGGVYRRLRDIRAFDPTFRWDFVYSLPALLGGSDVRDYYGATGAELGVSLRNGPWTGRLGTRWERQDSVRINTDRFLFGEAEDFPSLAPVEPGTHAALEGEIAYARGSGAVSIGNSAIASLRAEAGVGDFGFGRAAALLSLRRSLGPLTLVGRLDAGHAWGDVPPQKLFRFGSSEGLRGYEPNEFGGSSAAIARGRLLIGLPPRGAEPLARSGIFVLPPLRPSLVLLGEAGWAEASGPSLAWIERVGSAPTNGTRGSVGAGLSLFNDFFSVEWVRPLEKGRDGRWYVGLVQWF